MPLDRLTIEDMSDREFLLVVRDVADGDGWADSEHVHDRIGVANRHSAPSRLSWLSRWGAVEREHQRDQGGNIRYRRDGKPFYTQRWRLTDIGEDLAMGSLLKRDSAALDKLNDSQMLIVTAWLAERARHANPTVTKLVAREWRYGSSSLRNGRVT